MNIRPVIDIVTVAGATLVLSACSEEQQRSFSGIMHTLGATDAVTQQHVAEMQEAVVVEAVETVPVVEVAVVEPLPVVEPEPPAHVYETICWDEPRRGGTWVERVCEMRPAT